MASNQFQNPRSAAMDFPFGGLEAGSEGRDASLAQGLVPQNSKPKGLLQTGIMQNGDVGNIPTVGVAGT